LAFSPDGRYFVAGGGGQGLKESFLTVWDTATGRAIAQNQGLSAHHVAFAPKADPPLIASTSTRGTRTWDVMSDEEIKLDAGWANCVAFSPNGELVASGRVDGVVKIWDTQSWKKLPRELSDTGCITSLVFHPKDSRVLAWASTSGKVQVWDSVTKETRALHGHTGPAEWVAFSPDGEWIASASGDGTVKIWRVP
jgi:WD40 repeat protein